MPVNWDELLEWREWILESPDFATALYEGGMLRVVDGAKEKKEK